MSVLVQTNMNDDWFPCISRQSSNVRWIPGVVETSIVNVAKIMQLPIIKQEIRIIITVLLHLSNTLYLNFKSVSAIATF
jgi:hypothetical protein